MTEEILQKLTLVVALGIAAQWVAWRIGLPSILILLLTGFAAGPWFGIIDPDAIAGDMLMPVVSLSVALILFEGGLNLKFAELKETGSAVWGLVSLGAAVAFGLTTVLAHALLGWDWALATLFGAILVVTGPTVVMPMLRHIQPSRQVANVLKWEGIVIDPIGALLALLVFEVGHALPDAGGAMHPVMVFVTGVLKTAGIGVLFGTIGAVLIFVPFRKFWIPDYLQNPFVIMVVLSAFTASNALQHESGLFTVTLMGIILANQKRAKIKHIIEFKENLRVLLIGALFIVLAARLDRSQFTDLPWSAALGLLALLIFVIRPVSVLSSTLRTSLTWKERIFVGFMAPRGIVAASVASIFAIALNSGGAASAEALQLVPMTFIVIVGTVAFYGLTASPLAKLLGISNSKPQGILIVGAHQLARDIAKSLMVEKIHVIVADTNRQNIAAARLAGISTHYGSILSGDIDDDLDMAGIGRILAFTPNDEVNSLAALHFREHFGSSEVYQVALQEQTPAKKDDKVADDLQGRTLFSSELTFPALVSRFSQGFVIKKNVFTEEFSFDDFMIQYGEDTIPMFLLEPSGRLRVFAADSDIEPKTGDKLISLVEPLKEGEEIPKVVAKG